jgi:DNA-directed RNA polymerase subunit H (RpoH/RPB5)
MTDEDKWNQQVEWLKEYIIENNKLPSATDKDPKIKTLGIWLSSQQKNYKNKQYSMAIKSQYDKWTEFLTEYAQYFVSNEDVWVQNFEPTKEYITKHNKLPSQRDKDPKIKKIGLWVSNQQQNYKNKQHSMAIKSQYDKWTEFLTEYAQYFVSNEDKWIQIFEPKKSISLNTTNCLHKKIKIQKLKSLEHGYHLNNKTIKINNNQWK